MAEEAFKKSVEEVKAGLSVTKTVPTDRKLKVYGFYKQATEGDVTGSQPWAVQVESRSKWDAWNAVKGMSKEEAMENYTKEVEAQKVDFA
mmetsp:Transcript_103286/g.274716  ORF Transcript_103286/g.274716 Transcript_103286/m.274716 type:complete len:90 (+) Transcript_103286:80-349(+)